MKKENFFSKKKFMEINSNYFTGSVSLKELSKTIKSKSNKMYYVSFKNGSRTKIHYHTGNQILIAVKGKGDLILYKKIGNGKSRFKINLVQRISLKPGDVVHIPAKKLHSHGSTRKNLIFSHLAINAYPSLNHEPKTVWYESDFKKNVMKILE